MLTNDDKDNILNDVVERWTELLHLTHDKVSILSRLLNWNLMILFMRVSYIGNTPAFQAGKVGSIPTTRSIMRV